MVRPKRHRHVRPTSFTTLLFQEKQAAQSIAEALADLANVPITICGRPNAEQLFKAISAAADLPFSSLQDFHDFIVETCNDPGKAAVRFASEPKKWRPVFDTIEQKLIVVRSRRSEPVVKILREHWPWKWLELASIYNDCVLRVAQDNDALEWEAAKSSGLLSSKIISAGTSRLLILVGPVRIRRRPEYQPDVSMLQLVEWFYGCIGPHLQPLYSIERLTQFFFSRPPLMEDEFNRTCLKISTAFELLDNYDIRLRETLDLGDFQSASLFAFLIATLSLDRRLWAQVQVERLVIAANYDVLTSEERHVLREHVFDGSLASLEGSINTREAKLTGLGNGGRAVVVRSSSTTLLESLREELEGLLEHELSSLWSSAQIARAQQNLEELLLLRYKLSDNFGVLTATGAPQVKRSLEQRADRELGRRIAREIAEITCGSSAVIYRYDYLAGHLSMVGAHIETKRKRLVVEDDYTWMSLVGHEPAERGDSVSYHAADRNKATSFNSSVSGAKLVDRVSTQATPPTRSPVPLAGSILAVPIRVFGRVWGVIEVLSPRQGWFNVADLEIMQRIADLIGPYYHEHELMRLLYSMAAAPAQDDTNAAFDGLAAQIREMTLSDASCVWVSDMLNVDEFVLAGCSGRPDLRADPEADVPRIRKHAQNSISLSLMKSQRGWAAGLIGEAPFDDRWLTKPHTKGLPAAGFKYIALLPVYAEETSRQAVVSLYSKQSEYSDGWQNWGSFIASYLGVLLNRILNATETERQARRLVAHEVNNAVRIAKGSSDKLFRWVGDTSASPLPVNFENWKSDVQNYLAFIEQLVSAWAESEAGQGDWTPELILLASLQKKAQSPSLAPASLRLELNSSLRSLSREMRRRNLDTSISIPRGDVGILIHREALKMILSNLSANAIKYSTPGGLVRCEGFRERFGFKFTMSNLGRPLGEGEDQRLFDMGFRGHNARTRTDGSGLGLYIAKSVCKLYNIALTYDARRSGRAKEVWHQFSLEFPSVRIASKDYFGG